MIQFPIVVEIVYPDLLAALTRIAVATEALRTPRIAQFVVTGGLLRFSNIQPQLGGSMPLYNVPATQADEPFTISAISATDAEGNVKVVTEDLSSSDDTVVQVNFDTPGSVRSGNVHFGVPGTATVTYTAMADGVPIKSVALNFVLGAGPASVITGGDFAFATITPTEP